MLVWFEIYFAGKKIIFQMKPDEGKLDMVNTMECS